ncbi:probable serine/threonine-protein kinase drkC [Corticium candelabrum]|uniref:probable serine/threonine-protein kinase drkC n=1 Tax=Corticium candelabrum TaxID=121492 RepID=UPI002E259DAF|nr:probable serine/threonine-protein kinase drkC [Corticium candelabrum]
MLILVTLVPFLAILIVTSLSCCCIRTVRHRRARTRTEKELEETRKAFTIRTPEIEMISRLDEDCPGGYGQVHKATYRDWTVAVKQLQLVMVEWDDVRREFLREIQFMRTVRHPNIVMFIGAGQYNKDQPFLVLEYMGGGALCSLLHKKEVELCAKQKLRFVLEAAKGMDYLHTLKPPRIHRDLKSANLLLSLNWQVKVADFGSARLIPQPDQARATKDKRFQKQSNTDEEKDSKQLLDECSYLTSKHIGTARWRSPEVWKNMSYGTPTDVYSFAIVVWEILTREIPFSGSKYKFDAQVECDVLAGIRPPTPNDACKIFRKLMEECWQHKPEARPQFTSIVSRLESMHCKDQ